MSSAIEETGSDLITGEIKEEAIIYDLVKLSADSLILKDSEDTYEYGRQQLKKPDSDIKLEEASADDYKI